MGSSTADRESPNESALDETQRYQLYIDERKMLIEAIKDSASSFDKAILTFGSGAFAISIAFLKDIAPNPHPNTLPLLGWSWLLFAASLVLILVAFVMSQKACNAQIDISYDELVKRMERRKNGWGIATTILNYLSILVLALAFLLSGLFVYWNKIHTS